MKLNNHRFQPTLLRSLLCGTLLVWLTATPAAACNVPVFRYALERWTPDAVELIVFHDTELTPAQLEIVDRFRGASMEGAGTVNIRVSVVNVADAADESHRQLWESLRQKKATLPCVAVQSRLASRTVTNWHGSLAMAESASLLTSPARKELSNRILSGDAAVWMVVTRGKPANDARVEALRAQLKKLSEETPLPEGVGLPGSELFANVPLLTRFSLLEVDSADPREQFLVELLRGFEPDAIESGEPLVVPVFGRARALEVIPISQLDETLVEDLSLFLCGACSCQVKAQNPGFDLLTDTDWNERLFGDTGTALPPLQIPTSTPEESVPQLLDIPSGRSGDAAADTTSSADVDSASGVVAAGADDVGRSASVLSLFVALLVIVVITLALAHSSNF